MSRIGKKPVVVPSGVTVNITEGNIKIKGPKGELAKAIPPLVEVVAEKTAIVVRQASQDRRCSAMQGLARSLIQNMVTGVSKGFTRVLEINGVGYKSDGRPGVLSMTLGYSHPLEVMLPAGIAAKVEKNRIELSGIDREVLGQTAAIIREQRGPEPYKGKGIKYAEETIRRKVGKAGAS